MPPPTSAIVPTNILSVTVASSAGGTLIITANSQRNGLSITNRSAVILTVVPIIPGVTAVPVAGATGLGIDIAAGATQIFGPAAGALLPFFWTAGVQGIAASATAVVTVMEF